MTKTSLFAALLLIGIAGAAEAGGQAASIGVGAEYQLSGVGGASMNYDGGDWHAGGFLGFLDAGQGDDDTLWQAGGRFYYHLHTTTDADFGLGGSLGVLNAPAGGGNDFNAIYVEPGVQIRLFLAANVAISVTTGIILALSDADGVAITGGTVGGAQTIGLSGTGGFGFSFGGGAGIHYYFF